VRRPKIYADNEYKLQILDEEADDEEVTFYVQDDWQDLCQGPHVESTGEIGATTLLEVSAAYWRGDEDNDTLTRVYGTAFASESDLKEHLELREEALERDHRKIGQEMNLFSIPTVTGPGLPLYHPPGKTVLRELSNFANELNRENGYEEVETRTCSGRSCGRSPATTRTTKTTCSSSTSTTRSTGSSR